MMAGRETALAISLGCAILLSGCAQSAQHRARIERARADFVAGQGATGFDAAAEGLADSPKMEFPSLREFRDCSVRRAWIFEQISVSREVEFWAIELEFTGTDTETGRREDGRAVLLYRAFRQISEDEVLIGIFPGTTPDEIEMIEGGTKAAFEFLRQETGSHPGS